MAVQQLAGRPRAERIESQRSGPARALYRQCSLLGAGEVESGDLE
jgi:hypothetical protein